MADNIILPETKKHAACDECRVRKLKCSGDQPTCSRCVREKIECFYSPQKQMGRPRKRKGDEGLYRAQRRTPPSPAVNLGHTSRDPLVYFAPGVTDTDANDMGFQTASAEPLAPQLIPYAVDNPHPPMGSFMFPEPTGDSAFPLDPALFGFAPNTEPIVDMSGSSADSTAISPDSTTMTDTASTMPHPSCACLSSMYLTLSDLQGMTTHAFPFALRPIKQAKSTAEQVLDCRLCTHDALGGYLNVTIITSLLFALADSFRRVVEDIDAEAARAEESGAIKRFQLGDANPGNIHLHTQTHDCPARFDLELDADGWRSMSKKVVRQEVYGASSRGDPKSLVGLITRLEQRQLASHADPEHIKLRDRLWGQAAVHEASEKGDWQCVKQARNVRLMIDRIPW